MRAAPVVVSLFVSAFLISGCGGGGGGAGDNQITVVGPEGGTFRFDGGVVLEVPPGAVSTPHSVTVELLDPAATQALMNESGMQERSFIAGASFSPSGLQFDLPVQVTLPAGDVPVGSSVPIHFFLDEATNAFYPANTDLSVDGAAGTVTLQVTAFSSHAVAGVTPDPTVLPAAFEPTAVNSISGAGVISTILAQRCIDAGEDPCRCGLFHVETTSRDAIYTSSDGTCSASLDTGIITYLSCLPVQTESWGFVEHSDGCVPQLTLTPDKAAVVPGETTGVTAGIIYGVDPVGFQDVALTSNELLILSEAAVTTDETGLASFQATAGSREGAGVIRGTATVEYVPVEIVINNEPEPWPMDPRQKTVTARTAVAIDAPLTLEVSILPGVHGNYLVPGEETLVSVAILDPNPNAGTVNFVPSEDVFLSVDGGALGSSTVRTSSLGEVTVGYTAPGASGLVTVQANATVEFFDSAGELDVVVLSGQDTIEILEKPVERWSGILEITPYMDMGYDPLNPDYTPAIAEASVYIPFTLTIDPDLADPGPGNPNATGTGDALVDVFTSDSDLLYSAGGIEWMQEYWIETAAYPFTATFEGVVTGSGSGRRLDLAVRHPDGEGSTVATALLGDRYYNPTDGITEVPFGFPFWLEWRDALHMNSSNLQVPIPLILGTGGTVDVSGECMYDLWTQCTYTLSMARD